MCEWQWWSLLMSKSKLRATSMGMPLAAVDTRWYSRGCYLAPGFDCSVKQFCHGSCPCNAWPRLLLCIGTRFGELGLQVWWPLSLIRTPGQLWLGTTSSQATLWLLLTSPIPWWEQHQAAPSAHQPPPLTPHGKRERGLTFHLRRGNRAPGPRARAGGNTNGRSLVLSMLPGAGKSREQ